jgi:ABC-type Fe3+-citrate transport system substrate-binding protein
MHEKQQKILSLVPSWTETLLECGLNVVGRTRFCIHPEGLVKNIPAVGGTKNFKMDEVLKLKPDFVILDKEENRKEMAEILQENGIQLLVSHVTSINDAISFIRESGKMLDSKKLQELAESYADVSLKKMSLKKFSASAVLSSAEQIPTEDLGYVIWKNPYMCISSETFIADVLIRFGLKLKDLGQVSGERYPVVQEAQLKELFCLFSSEPYPFSKEFNGLIESGFRGALVDGEKISWYGIRNFRFLKECAE